MKLSVLLAACVAATAFAQPAPSPKLDQLEPFLGLWRCSGTAFTTPLSKEHKTRAWIHVTSELSGFWVDSEFSEDRTSENPHPNAGKVHWGFDETTQKFTGSAVDNNGGLNTPLESDGMQGDTIVWRGTAHTAAGAFATRDTFTRKSSTEIAHTGEAFLNGVWIKLDEESCRKFHFF